ncbi:MAG: LysR family transcriptional regulator [Actinomycetota bacterium]
MRPLLRQVPQLQRLAVFEAVARLGTFTAAGAELGISQPACSKQVAQLEDQLRIQLFDRTTGRPQLTSDGNRLHQTLTTSFADLELTLSELRSGLDVLTLAVQPALASNWIAPRLGEIHELIAPSRLHVTIFEHHAELETTAHDVSIRFGDGLVPHMRSEKLVSEVAVPAASPDYAEAHGLHPDTDPEQLLDCDLLEFDSTGQDWATWARWFSAFGLFWARPVEQIVYRGHASVIAQAMMGRGVILTWSAIRQELFATGRLVECGPTLVVPDLGHHLVWPQALSRDRGFRRLRDWLHDTRPRSGM